MDVTRLIWTLTMNPCIDLFAEVQEMEPRRKLRSTPPLHQPGGGGINVARAVHGLGGAALALFPAGGLTGSHIRYLLEREGVMSHSISTRNLSRQSFAVRDSSTGDQYRFVMPGPEMPEEEWGKFLTLIEGVSPAMDVLVASGSLPSGVPEDFYARLARTCKTSATRLFLDASGPALRTALDEGVYLVTPNLRELREISGKKLDTTEEQREACEGLVRSGAAEIIALTLGKEGACVVWKDGFLHMETPDVPVQSTIGAGDSFMAGMTLGVSRGWELRDAFRLALAAGTAAVMTPASGLCRREDVEELYGRLKAGE